MWLSEVCDMFPLDLKHYHRQLDDVCRADTPWSLFALRANDQFSPGCCIRRARTLFLLQGANVGGF